MGYIEMLHLYHEFSRNVRTGDLDLYILCLPKITDNFFAFIHHNYAKWLVLFNDNSLKIKITYSKTNKKLKNGCFSLKRTKKVFKTASRYQSGRNNQRGCRRPKGWISAIIIFLLSKDELKDIT